MQEDKLKILVVEHDQDTLLLIERTLNKAGYAVQTCNTGSDLVEFRHPVPDIFILDRELPTIDGIAVTKFLRLQVETKTIPIFMISEYDVEKKAILAGIDEFITKPFQIDYLLKLIKKYSDLQHNGKPK